MLCIRAMCSSFLPSLSFSPGEGISEPANSWAAKRGLELVGGQDGKLSNWPRGAQEAVRLTESHAVGSGTTVSKSDLCRSASPAARPGACGLGPSGFAQAAGPHPRAPD